MVAGLGNPTLGPELQQKIVAGVLQESAGRSIDELDHYRDEVVLGLLSLRAKAVQLYLDSKFSGVVAETSDVK